MLEIVIHHLVILPLVSELGYSGLESADGSVPGIHLELESVVLEVQTVDLLFESSQHLCLLLPRLILSPLALGLLVLRPSHFLFLPRLRF